MKKTKYLAWSKQKEISIKYYKVDTEETVKQLFFKQYGKFPQMIINVSEYGNNLAKIALLAMTGYIIKLKVENHNLNSKFNKAISDGMRNHSSVCARFMREKRIA